LCYSFYHTVDGITKLFNPISPPALGNGYRSPDPTETYELHDYVGSIPTLVAGGSGLTGIFADLGMGALYASTTVSAADDNTLGLNLGAIGFSAGVFMLYWNRRKFLLKA